MNVRPPSIVFAVGFLTALSSALPITPALATTIVLPLVFETTLTCPEGGSRDCFGTLAVSESANRLFVLDTLRDQVVIYNTLTLANLGTVPVDLAGTVPRMLAVGHHPDGPGTGFDDHVFISDAEGDLRVLDAATLAPIATVAGSLPSGRGFDDGFHMVVDTPGERIFVTDHDGPLLVFDFALTPLDPLGDGLPLGAPLLDEPLGIAALPDGTLFVTDEDDDGGLFRLNPDLSLDFQVPAFSNADDFDGAEGIALAVDSGLVFVADEDDEEVEIFDAATLEWVGDVDVNATGDGPYWLGVDEGVNLDAGANRDIHGRLFLLSDGRVPGFPASGNFGVHVYSASAPVPEPGTLALFTLGLAGLGFARRRLHRPAPTPDVL